VDALSGALVGTDSATFAVIVIEGIGVLTVFFGQDYCHVWTEDPTASTRAILYPEAGFWVMDGLLSSPSSCLIFLRVTRLYDVTGHRDFVIFLAHPIIASFTALSIATLFKSPTLPGYRSRTSLMTVSTSTTPVALTAAAIVGML